MQKKNAQVPTNGKKLRDQKGQSRKKQGKWPKA